MDAGRKFGICSTFETTNRIITGSRTLKVKMQDRGPALSWTDGKDVFFAEILLDDLRVSEIEQMAILTGLNYHEVAHVLYTPFSGRYFEACRAESLNLASNALEDQRIEAHFLKRYRPATDYFVQAITRTIIEDEDFLPMSWMVVAGRYYLPHELRERSALAMVDVDLRNAFAEIIDEYVTVNPYTQATLALELTRRYDQLMKRLQKEHQEAQELSLEHDCGMERKGTGNGTPRYEDLDIPDEESATTIAVAVQGGDGDQEDGDEEGNLATLREVVEEALEEATKEVRKDASERRNSVREQESKYTPSAANNQRPMSQLQHRQEKPSIELVRLADRISDEMAELQTELDSGWYHRVDHGNRVDPMRVEISDHVGGDEFHSRWDEGVSDVLAVEAVFLLDASYSMCGAGMGFGTQRTYDYASPIAEASRALWALHRGLTMEHAVPVTAWSFSEHTRLLIDRFQASTPQVPLYDFEGNTNVKDGLNWAQNVLDASDRNVPVLFIITDGGFNDPEDQSYRIDSYPYPIVMIGLGYDVEDRWHTSEYRAVVESKTVEKALDIVPVVRRAVLRLAATDAGTR